MSSVLDALIPLSSDLSGIFALFKPFADVAGAVASLIKVFA
ncbi:hypothetical protein [Corynebacterium vitaeruminis]|nr:hypothetical protein [Corynebacterium vitaeruminis]